MERYSFLQDSDVTTTSNYTSVRHICDQYRSNLPNVTRKLCEIVRNTDCWVLEVTSQQSPDPSSLKHGREPKWWWFQCVFPYFNGGWKFKDLTKSNNSFEEMLTKAWRFFKRKKNLGIRCTLRIFSSVINVLIYIYVKIHWVQFRPRTYLFV